MPLEAVVHTIATAGVMSPSYVPVSSESIPPQDAMVDYPVLCPPSAGNNQIHAPEEVGQVGPIDFISVGIGSMELAAIDGPHLPHGAQESFGPATEADNEDVRPHEYLGLVNDVTSHP
jgi:hypothetical protein